MLETPDLNSGPTPGIGFGTVIFRFVRVIIVLALAAGLAMMLVALKKEPEKKQTVKTAPGVTVVTAIPESRTMTVEAFGTVVPRKKVTIAAEVTGRIKYIHPAFVAGGRIRAAETLIRIDPQTYQLEQAAAKVRIIQAETDMANLTQTIQNLNRDIGLSKENLALVRTERDRVRALAKNKFSSRNSLDRAEQQLVQARMQYQALENQLLLTDSLMEQKKAALAMARVDLARAELALERTWIKAGFDALVLSKNAEQGEFVNPGQNLGQIYQKGTLDVDVSIPMAHLKWIRSSFLQGQFPGVAVSLAGADVNAGFSWQGRVARLKADIDPQTRTLPMTVEIQPLPEGEAPLVQLRPGAFVRCRIIGQTVDNLFVLPRHLLKPDDRVFTVVSGALSIRQVTVFRKFEDQAYISAGLNSGDLVVSSPLPGALDGMALSVMQAGTEGGE